MSRFMRRLLLVGLVAGTAMGLATPAALADPVPIDDPIPEKPVPSRLALTLEEFVQFPQTFTTPEPIDPRLVRHARINYLGELPDRSGRLFVPDLNGRLYFVRNGTPHVYLDVGAAFAPDFISGRGLGSGFGFVAFHPQFARNGKFYTVHTEWGDALAKPTDLPAQPNTRFHGVIDEWTATDPRADTFSGTRREVLRLGFAGQIHGIQQIDFNPTARPHDRDYGLLYVAAGDGGQAARAGNSDSLDLAIPHGKILRIDPLGTDGPNGRYGVPRSNPFAGRPGVLGEIYAYGMRDPHRFSWDPHAGNRMFLGHIGEHAIEAIYDVRAGDNLGWPEREGPFVFNKNDRCHLYTLPDDDERFGYTYPVAAFDHDPPPGHSCTADSGHAVAGGFVYRGFRLPALHGKYLFADLVDGRVFFTNAHEMRRGRDLATVHQLQLRDAAGNPVTMPQLAGSPRVDLRWGRDNRGELYVLSKANGKVWRVTGARYVPGDVFPTLAPNLVAHYDFEHPVPGNPAWERDQGRSGTDIQLVNGGAAMRVRDGAYRSSRMSMQGQQITPTAPSNDDWKAGLYAEPGVPSLRAFNGVREITIMGWFKMTGQNPSPNSGSSNPDDFYGAIGLAGVLSGDSNGHSVRALLELIQVDGVMRVVALGRRIDGASSQTFAAHEDWRTLLPQNEWVFLAATFDYGTGTMALYRNGRPVDGFYVLPGDPWGVKGTPGPHVSSPTDPRGIKIAGSFPQNNREGNPCNCRFDGLMFLDRAVEPWEVLGQYLMAKHHP